MALVSLPEVKALGAQAERWQHKSAGAILRESVQNFSEERTYDVFLSHSYSDRTTVVGIKKFLEQYQLSVFVDWIAAQQLDRSKVTKTTAQTLKMWMVRSRCLLYACTPKSSESVWMPWELGYFDGLKGRVAILPLTPDKEYDDTYRGREYLGVYPYVSENRSDRNRECIWINETPDRYVNISYWLRGKKPYDH
jgi:TIR domain